MIQVIWKRKNYFQKNLETRNPQRFSDVVSSLVKRAKVALYIRFRTWRIFAVQPALLGIEQKKNGANAGSGRRGSKKMPEAWLRRQAVQIAAQLPEDPDDAIAVLELTKTLVETFLKAPPQADLALDRSVLAFPAASSNSR